MKLIQSSRQISAQAYYSDNIFNCDKFTFWAPCSPTSPYLNLYIILSLLRLFFILTSKLFLQILIDNNRHSKIILKSEHIIAFPFYLV